MNDTEKELILNNCDEQVKNLIQFNLWTGLRIYELIALKLCDIDLDNKIAHIQRAKVEYKIKGTKTKASVRKILMLDKAKEALINQLGFTKDCEYVFHNPYYNSAWDHSSQICSYWIRVLNQN